MSHHSLEEVLLKYRQNWMNIPGIQAVGAGMCNTGKCLRVFVSDDFDADASALPAKVEGYPVIVENAGPISAR